MLFSCQNIDGLPDVLVSNAKLVMTAFEELGVIPQLGEVVSELGWEFPTPIQCEAVPAILGGGDVLIAAETGSGKTGAFSLPLTQIVWEIRRDELEPKKKHDEHKLWLKSHKFKGPLLDSFCIIHQQKRIQESLLLNYFGWCFIGVAQASEACVNWCISNVSLLTKEDKTAPLCVVLEPTRELVEQTHNNLVFFSKNINKPTIRCLSMASGVQMSQVLKELSQGADIVTGTASRIVDLVESKQLSLGALQFIVIDEADQFLADKSSRLIERLFSYMPLVSNKGARLQVIVCSATLHNFEIKKFAVGFFVFDMFLDRFMHFPQWIDLKGMDTVAETVHQVVCRVDAVSDKQWIRYMHTPNHLEDDGVHQNDHICLGTNEKDTLSLGTKVLKGLYVLKVSCLKPLNLPNRIKRIELGLITVCLHGDRAPKERSQSLMDFKEKKIPFLICTDVAARGIDVHGVPFGNQGLITVCLHGDRAPKERSQSLMDFKEKKIPFLICTDVAARGIDVHGVPFGELPTVLFKGSLLSLERLVKLKVLVQ
uniref:ATP-dependent RNA helicase n=1 Tax=Heterorhabditis bacteriophora TaxID=37862 RepID=A0A1I7XE52_HETBA